MRISSSLIFVALYLGSAVTATIPAAKSGDGNIDDAGKRGIDRRVAGDDINNVVKRQRASPAVTTDKDIADKRGLAVDGVDDKDGSEAGKRQLTPSVVVGDATDIIATPGPGPWTGF